MPYPAYVLPQTQTLPTLRSQLSVNPDLVEQLDQQSTTNQIARGWRSADLSSEAGSLYSEANAARRRGDGLRAQALEQEAADMGARAQQWAPTVQNFTDVNSVESGLDWLGGQVGNLRTSAGPAAAGLVGSAAGAGLGLLTRRPQLGAQASRVLGGLGAFGAGYDAEYNEAMANAMTDPRVVATRTPEEMHQTARLKGLGAGALEAVVPYGVARATAGALGKATAKEVAKEGGSRVLAREALKDMSEEFATESSQSLVGQATQNYLRGEDLTNFDYKQAFNEGMGGAVGGGVMGAGAGALKAGGGKLRNKVDGAVDTAKDFAANPMGKVGDAIADIGGKVGSMMGDKEFATSPEQEQALADDLLHRMNTAGLSKEDQLKVVQDIQAGNYGSHGIDLSQADHANLPDDMTKDAELQGRAESHAAKIMRSPREYSSEELAAAAKFSAGQSDYVQFRSELERAKENKKARAISRSIDDGMGKASKMTAHGETVAALADLWLQEDGAKFKLFKNPSQDTKTLATKLMEWTRSGYGKEHGETFVPAGLVDELGEDAAKVVLSMSKLAKKQGLLRDDKLLLEMHDELRSQAMNKTGDHNFIDGMLLPLAHNQMTPQATRAMVAALRSSKGKPSKEMRNVLKVFFGHNLPEVLQHFTDKASRGRHNPLKNTGSKTDFDVEKAAESITNGATNEDGERVLESDALEMGESTDDEFSQHNKDERKPTEMRGYKGTVHPFDLADSAQSEAHTKEMAALGDDGSVRAKSVGVWKQLKDTFRGEQDAEAEIRDNEDFLIQHYAPKLSEAEGAQVRYDPNDVLTEAERRKLLGLIDKQFQHIQVEHVGEMADPGKLDKDTSSNNSIASYKYVIPKKLKEQGVTEADLTADKGFLFIERVTSTGRVSHFPINTQQLLSTKAFGATKDNPDAGYGALGLKRQVLSMLTNLMYSEKQFKRIGFRVEKGGPILWLEGSGSKFATDDFGNRYRVSARNDGTGPQVKLVGQPTDLPSETKLGKEGHTVADANKQAAQDRRAGDNNDGEVEEGFEYKNLRVAYAETLAEKQAQIEKVLTEVRRQLDDVETEFRKKWAGWFASNQEKAEEALQTKLAFKSAQLSETLGFRSKEGGMLDPVAVLEAGLRSERNSNKVYTKLRNQWQGSNEIDSSVSRGHERTDHTLAEKGLRLAPKTVARMRAVVQSFLESVKDTPLRDSVSELFDKAEAVRGTKGYNGALAAAYNKMLGERVRRDGNYTGFDPERAHLYKQHESDNTFGKGFGTKAMSEAKARRRFDKVNDDQLVDRATDDNIAPSEAHDSLQTGIRREDPAGGQGDGRAYTGKLTKPFPQQAKLDRYEALKELGNKRSPKLEAEFRAMEQEQELAEYEALKKLAHPTKAQKERLSELKKINLAEMRDAWALQHTSYAADVEGSIKRDTDGNAVGLGQDALGAGYGGHQAVDKRFDAGGVATKAHPNPSTTKGQKQSAAELQQAQEGVMKQLTKGVPAMVAWYKALPESLQDVVDVALLGVDTEKKVTHYTTKSRLNERGEHIRVFEEMASAGEEVVPDKTRSLVDMSAAELKNLFGKVSGIDIDIVSAQTRFTSAKDGRLVDSKTVDSEKTVAQTGREPKPGSVGSRENPHIVPMNYAIYTPGELRPDLRDKFKSAKKIADLIASGARTGTTRTPQRGVLPGHFIKFPGVAGEYRVVGFEKVDLKTPGGVAKWESREGWDRAATKDRFAGQVEHGKVQMIFERVEVAEDKTHSLVDMDSAELKNLFGKVSGIDIASAQTRLQRAKDEIAKLRNKRRLEKKDASSKQPDNDRGALAGKLAGTPMGEDERSAAAHADSGAKRGTNPGRQEAGVDEGSTSAVDSGGLGAVATLEAVPANLRRALEKEEYAKLDWKTKDDVLAFAREVRKIADAWDEVNNPAEGEDFGPAWDKHYDLGQAASQLVYDAEQVLKNADVQVDFASFFDGIEHTDADVREMVDILAGDGDVKHSRMGGKQKPSETQTTPEQQQAAYDFLTKALGDSVDLSKLFKKLSGVSGVWKRGKSGGKNIIHLGINGDVLGAAYHESMHELFDILTKHGNEETKAALLRVATNPIMLRKLENLLNDHPEAVAQLKQPEEALAFMFQFHQMGLLKIGEQTKGVFDAIKKILRKIAGIISETVRAENKRLAQEGLDADFARNLLGAFASGAYANSEHRQVMMDALKKDTEAHNQAVEAVGKSFVDFSNKAGKLFFSAEAMMDLTGNKHMVELARLFNHKVGTEMISKAAEGDRPGYTGSYLDAVRGNTNIWMNRLESMFTRFDKDTLELARQALSMDKVPGAPKVAEAVKAIREFYEAMYDYADKSDVRRLSPDRTDGHGGEVWEKLPRRKDYGITQVWDTDTLIKQGAQFKADLLKHHAKELAKIADEANRVVADPNIEVGVNTAAYLERERALAEFEKSGKVMAKATYNTITPEQVADALLLRLLNSQGKQDITESESDMGITPMASAINRRTLDWLDGEVFDKYKSKDLANIMSTYVRSMVKRAESQKRFGYGGEVIRDTLGKAVLQELGGDKLVKDAVDLLPLKVEAWKKAKGAWMRDEATKHQPFPIPFPTLRSVGQRLHSARVGDEKHLEALKAAMKKLEPGFKAVQAQEGTLGNDISPEARAMTSWATLYQNVRLLPTMLFSSFNDVVGIAANGGTMKDSWDAFVSGIKEIKNSITDKKTLDTLRSEEWGAMDTGSLMDTLGQTYNSVYMTGKAKRMSDAFFKYTGAEGWNRGVRSVAANVAERIITDWTKNGVDLSDPAKKAQVEHLFGKGFDPKTIKLDDQGRLDITDEANRAAVQRWVLDSVMSPNAANRPIWGSDPRWQLMMQMKNYTYTFHRVMLKNVIGQARLGNYRPAMVMLTGYVPVAIAGGALKEMLTPGDEPPWMKGGLDGYLQYGWDRAGLLGVPQMYASYLPSPMDVFDGKVMERTDPAAMFGPTADQIENLLVTPLLSNHTLGNEALSALPGGTLLKRLSPVPHAA